MLESLAFGVVRLFPLFLFTNVVLTEERQHSISVHFFSKLSTSHSLSLFLCVFFILISLFFHLFLFLLFILLLFILFLLLLLLFLLFQPLCVMFFIAHRQ